MIGHTDVVLEIRVALYPWDFRARADVPMCDVPIPSPVSSRLRTPTPATAAVLLFEMSALVAIAEWSIFVGSVGALMVISGEAGWRAWRGRRHR
jgi:hypothetical protein